MDRPIRAFTLCFEDAAYDESELARAQAQRSGSSFHPIPVTSRALADAYADAVWHAETPFVNGHGVAKFLLSRAVRDAGIKVVFTGEGSDEMLGGYAPFRRDVLLYNSARQDPATVSRLLAELRAANQAVPTLVTSEDAPIAELDTVRRRLGWIPSWIQTFSTMGERTRAIFSPEMAASVAGMNPYEVALSRLPVETPRGARPAEPGPLPLVANPPSQFHPHLPERPDGNGPLDRRARSLPRSRARRVCGEDSDPHEDQRHAREARSA
jgi:asparagine synthase (glutamine-hydrolysing)